MTGSRRYPYGPSASKKDEKVKTERSKAKFTFLVQLILLALVSSPRANAQSPSEWTHAASGNTMKPAQKATACSHVTGVGTRSPLATKKASVADLAPVFLPFFNNGPVFGLPGTEGGDFRHRTQLSGDCVNTG